jgi:PAS domain S-box-containing protein
VSTVSELSPSGNNPVVTSGVDSRDLLAAVASAEDDRRRLELALDAGQMGPWEWNIRTGVVRWSPAIERMHGIEEGSFPGTFEAYQRDMHPDDRERVLSTVQHALATKTKHHLVYRIVRPDGAVRWLEANGQFVASADGQLERLVGVCRDITEQKAADDAQARAALADIERARAEEARRTLEEIFEGIVDPFSVLDRELRLVFTNHAAAALLGTTPDTLVGKTPNEIVAGMEDSSFVRTYREVLATGTAKVVEDYFAPLDRWYEVSVYPLRNGIATYSRDVTGRKTAELLQARVARHERLRAEVSAALAANRAVREMLDACCKQLVAQLGVSFARIWTTDEAGQSLLLQASAGKYTHIDGAHAVVPVGKFKIGRIAAEREPHLTNDVQSDPLVGNQEWARAENMVSFAGYPLLVDDRVVGVMAMFGESRLSGDTLNALAEIADVVALGIERRRADIELQERAEDLARSNADLEQFAYVASHDLQEPLRMVSSYVQLLAKRYRGKLDKDADEFIGYAVEGATRMQRLINDLLTYSRVGRRGKELVPTSVDHVVDLAVDNLRAAITESQAEITRDPLPEVLGDERQLMQLFQNLIGNAVKFRGPEAPRVHIACRREPTEFVFAVTDNGIGIDPQYFDRIFVIFQRLNAREDYPGTGIGLALCKKIVERHGGRIWVESAAGRGASIQFTIPAASSRRRLS